ncbi:MAG: hypothetical protein KA214_05130 [Neisseriaceae bacterium]|nr:hypothetical protein [Neisseriaceae bacterium]
MMRSRRWALGFCWWWLSCSMAWASMTESCGGSSNQTPMSLNGNYTFSGPLHQSRLVPAPALNQILSCLDKLSLGSVRAVEGYVEVRAGLQWQMLDGKDYVDLGNGIGLLVEVADTYGRPFAPLTRAGGRVVMFTGYVRVPVGIRYRLTVKQIGPLRASTVNMALGTFYLVGDPSGVRRADINLSFTLRQGQVWSCNLTQDQFVTTLQPVSRQLLLAQSNAELFGGVLVVGGLQCPQDGVVVKAVLSDNEDDSLKTWLTARHEDGSKSGVGFRFKEHNGQQALTFGPEGTQPGLPHQFGFSVGPTSANQLLSKTFDVYYVNAHNGAAIEGGPIKGYGRITFSYQ